MSLCIFPTEATNGGCLMQYLPVCKMGILCSEKLPEKPKEVCNVRRESSEKEVREEHSSLAGMPV